jgi:anti-sigma regulatory factor (Ser/Thr protein kinase)
MVSAGTRSWVSSQAAWELPTGPGAPAAGRAALRGWLAELGIDSGDGKGADIVLAVSELVANAVVHGLPPVALAASASLADGVLVVTVGVSDANPVLPEVPAPAALTAEHGRGLALVAALSDRWGVSRLERGKRVWSEVAMPPAVAADEGALGPGAGPFGINGEDARGAGREVLAS